MTDVSKELLPCPFCGSADVEVRESITDAMVACNNCGSRTGLVYLGASDAENAAKIREAVSIWNTRAQPAPADVVERIKRDVTAREREAPKLNSYEHGFNNGLHAALAVVTTDPAISAMGVSDEVERLRGWVEDAYLEAYSQGVVAGTLVCREDDWLKSKARQALAHKEGNEQDA